MKGFELESRPPIEEVYKEAVNRREHWAVNPDGTPRQFGAKIEMITAYELDQGLRRSVQELLEAGFDAETLIAGLAAASPAKPTPSFPMSRTIPGGPQREHWTAMDQWKVFGGNRSDVVRAALGSRNR